jgi:hypothetical protein
MPAYYLAPSLVQLRSEVNARWPGRDKASDGWIGDTSHAARKSDHNPDWAAGGIVRAIDVDKDGIDPLLLVAAACADPRTNYVIFNRRIYTRSYGFKPTTYTGANPHDKHVHVSIRHGATYEQDTSGWLGATATVSRPVTGAGGSIPTPTGALPGALTPEDDMFDDNDRRALQGIATFLEQTLRVPGQVGGYPQAIKNQGDAIEQKVGDVALFLEQHGRNPATGAGWGLTNNVAVQALEARVIALQTVVDRLAAGDGDPAAIRTAVEDALAGFTATLTITAD